MEDRYLKEISLKIDAITALVKGDRKSKYLTANQAEKEYGISSKTLLNRSNLSATDTKFVPAVRLNGGRKKYFERKMLDRLFTITSIQENS